MHKFYVGRDTEMLIRKYAVFICSQIQPEFDWMGRELDDIHGNIYPPVKKTQKEKGK